MIMSEFRSEHHRAQSLSSRKQAFVLCVYTKETNTLYSILSFGRPLARARPLLCADNVNARVIMRSSHKPARPRSLAQPHQVCPTPRIPSRRAATPRRPCCQTTQLSKALRCAKPVVTTYIATSPGILKVPQVRALSIWNWWG